MRGRNEENIYSLSVHHYTFFTGGITHICGGLLLLLLLVTTSEVLEGFLSLKTAVFVWILRSALSASLSFIFSFTCSDSKDSGEPDPSSPAHLLYFLCVTLSEFFFLPSVSLPQPLCWQLDYRVSMQSQKATARQNHVLSHPWLLRRDEGQQRVTMGTRGSRRKVWWEAKMTGLCLCAHATCINRFDWGALPLQVAIYV